MQFLLTSRWNSGYWPVTTNQDMVTVHHPPGPGYNGNTGISFELMALYTRCQHQYLLRFSFLCQPVFILAYGHAGGILPFKNWALWQVSHSLVMWMWRRSCVRPGEMQIVHIEEKKKKKEVRGKERVWARKP